MPTTQPTQPILPPLPPLPTLFVPHGAPTFALQPGAAGAALRELAATLPVPRAIVVVSAHWDSAAPTIGMAEKLDTIHDFSGFPAALYDIRYPAHGSLAVCEEVRRLLRLSGFEPRFDEQRGLDHGAWIPLRLMFPNADIPVIPLSIQSQLGAPHHFRLGQALAALPEQGVLLLASGNLTHNLRDYHSASMSGMGSPPYVRQFADWMWAHLADGDSAALLDYRRLAPHAARAHPSEDHLLPLYVALGAAGTAYAAERRYSGIDSLVLAMDMFAFRPATPHQAKEFQL